MTNLTPKQLNFTEILDSNLMKFLAIILAILMMSCNRIPCLSETEEGLASFEIINGGAKWNCGSENWIASKVDLDSICSLLADLKPIGFTSVQVHHWFVDLEVNQVGPSLFEKSISLVSTKRNGLVFRIGQSCYRNDEFAKYIMKKIDISTDQSGAC